MLSAVLGEDAHSGRGRLATGAINSKPGRQNEESHRANEEGGDGRRGLGRKQVELRPP